MKPLVLFVAVCLPGCSDGVKLPGQHDAKMEIGGDLSVQIAYVR